jgi:membrane associated rhomboid family serine protease
MKIQYNSPVVLTYALLCAIVLLLSSLFGDGFKSLFVLHGNFDVGSMIDYVRLFTYVIGHANWTHLIGNFALILVVGPILEEKYGSSNLLKMIVITALVTAALNIIFFNENVLGASGIAFMLILLSSFSSFQKGHIPLTFILVFLLYIGREVVNSFEADHVSQFGHIMGGVCGGLFGFYINGDKSSDGGSEVEGMQ